MQTCNASGTHQMKIWYIGKSKKPRCFKAAKVRIESLNCEYRHNKKAWMTTLIMEEYLRWFDSQMSGRKVLLLMDNFSDHNAAFELIQALPS